MKYKCNYFPILLIAATVLSIHSAIAQTVLKPPQELVVLRARYDTEVAAAVQPIQSRYISELQKLLKTVTQRGDLPSANAVQVELDKLTNASGKPIPVGSPQSKLVGTSWENADGSRIEFLAGGQFRELYRKKTFPGTWKAISETEADVTLSIGQRYHYKFESGNHTVSRSDTPAIWKPAK